MPTYEYECTNNGFRFDAFQSVGEAPPACPECGAPTKKVFGVPRVIFKGSGFYVTDKRAEASSSSAKKDAGDSKSESGDAKTETKSDSKTESKGDTSTANTSSAPASNSS